MCLLLFKKKLKKLHNLIAIFVIYCKYLFYPHNQDKIINYSYYIPLILNYTIMI